MTDKQIIIDGVDTLKDKINMCFILLINKLETSETIERTIYEHLDAFVDEWNKQLQQEKKKNKELQDILRVIKMLSNDEYCQTQECGCDDYEECFNCIQLQIRKALEE